MKVVKCFFYSVLCLSAVFYMGSASAAGVAVEDVNLDNIPDVVVSEGGAAQPQIFLGKGDGTFESANASARDKEAGKRAEIAKIMGERKSQVALTLNEDLSFDALGVRAGKKAEPCSKKNPCRFDPKKDRDKAFAHQDFSITVFKGSCCAYISSGSSTYEFCTPRWPLFFVNSLSGESCPSGAQ